MSRFHAALLLSVFGSLGACRGDAAPPAAVNGSAEAAAPAAEALAGALVGEIREQELAAALEQHLLTVHPAWRGPGCDRNVPACAAAAREVARDHAGRQAAAIRQALVGHYAQRLAAEMSEEEMRTALAHLRSPGGAALARGLRSLLAVDQRGFAALITAVGMAAAQGREGAVDAFHDRTRGLPRRTDLGPAPPPPRP
jgi:hypothetical protein